MNELFELERQSDDYDMLHCFLCLPQVTCNSASQQQVMITISRILLDCLNFNPERAYNHNFIYCYLFNIHNYNGAGSNPPRSGRIGMVLRKYCLHMILKSSRGLLCDMLWKGQ
jgi:hypothetical protein